MPVLVVQPRLQVETSLLLVEPTQVLRIVLLFARLKSSTVWAFTFSSISMVNNTNSWWTRAISGIVTVHHESYLRWMADAISLSSISRRNVSTRLSPSSGVPPGINQISRGMVHASCVCEMRPSQHKHRTRQNGSFLSLSSSTKIEVARRLYTFSEAVNGFLCWDSTPCFTANRMISRTL